MFSRLTLRPLLPLILVSTSLADRATATAMFRGDAAHSGVFDSVAPADLQPKWKFRTGGAIRSSPTVADKTVFVGSSDNHVYAVDEETGTLRWKFDAHGDVHSSPAVADDTIFVTSQDGNLYAIDQKTGAQRWAFATKGERRFTKEGIDYMAPATEMMPDPWDFYLSSPAVMGDAVYFGSGDGRIYAVNAADGKLRWSFETGDVVHASPAVVGGVVYVGSFDSYFYAIDATTGTVKWKFKTGADDRTHLMTGIPGSAVIAAGKVYFGSRDANVYALDCETGAQLWKFGVSSSWVVASPAVSEGRVYFTTSDTHEFVALDAATGAKLFALDYAIFGFSSPALAGGRAFFGTFDGKVHAVDLVERRYTATFATEGYQKNAAQYLDENGQIRRDVVWTGETLDDAIVAIHTKIFSLGSFLSSPAIHGGAVFIGSVDGTLYALGDVTAKSGR